MKRRRIKSSWKEYLHFSTRERRGISVLAVIIFIQITAIYFLENYSPAIPPPDLALLNSILKKDSAAQSAIPDHKDSLFHFNPNNIHQQEWMLLGLTEKQSHTITHFLDKGGSFRTKKDLKKMYGLDNSVFEKLYAWIDLPDSNNFQSKKEFRAGKYEKKFLISTPPIQQSLKPCAASEVCWPRG